MARTSSIFVIFLIKGMLFDPAYGIIGKNVRDIEANERFEYTVSISERARINCTDHRFFLNLHICTGALVSRKSILTAAHCLTDKEPSNIEIIAGSRNLSKGKKYYPKSWITFNQWNRNKKSHQPRNDIAVIILNDDGITNPDIHPLPMLTVDHEYLRGKHVSMLGWGKMETGYKPNALKRAKLMVISNEECSIQGTMLKASNFNVPPNYICSKTHPWVLSSPGDGGAPIIDRSNHLVAINVGVCPKVADYPEQMLHELQMNCHLNFHYYKDFLNDVIVK